jgi:hypothetical protein
MAGDRIGNLTEEQFADKFAPTLAPPIGVELSGTFEPADADLTALRTNTNNGLWARTGDGTGAARAITAGAGITVNNGSGVAGNPEIVSTITQYTDEQARDAIGTALQGTANQITITVNDGADTITLTLPNAVTLPGSLTVTTTLAVNGNATLGDAAGDVHAINGAVTHTVNANGQQGWNCTDGGNNVRITPSNALGVALAGTTTNDDFSLIRNGGVLLTLGASSVDVATALLGASSIKSSGATQGVGYATGAGGTVTQATSKSTGVTLNKCCGEITLNGAALASATVVSFVLTNSAIAATDNIILNHTATGTFGAYLLNGRCAAGSATIDVRNVTAGSLSEAIVIRFTVLKGVTS